MLLVSSAHTSRPRFNPVLAVDILQHYNIQVPNREGLKLVLTLYRGPRLRVAEH
jgi:hypothetical protein